MNYKVRFVDFPLHYSRLQGEIDAAIKEILLGGDYILRRHLEEFEKKLAAFVGVKHAIGLNSGTDALHLSLIAAGIGHEDEVITVSHTFVATISTIVHCGATPILIDIGDDDNMNVDLLEAAITPRTRAIIPVHLNGRLCDMEKIMAIASKNNLLVIEDAAQALGATLNNKPAGSFGLTGCFSFYPAKILGSLGDAGTVVTDSDEIAAKIRLLRDHGQDRATGEITGHGFNSRLDNLQAAVLNVKLKHLPAWIERRRELATLYEKLLSSIDQVRTPPPPASGSYFDIFTNYVIHAEERDRLVAHLRDSGIEILISWPKPTHHHKALELSHFQLPKTERASREVLSLPLNTEIENEQVEYVADCIRRFFKK